MFRITRQGQDTAFLMRRLQEVLPFLADGDLTGSLVIVNDIRIRIR